MSPTHATLSPDIPLLLEVLNKHQVDYVLIGSVAAQVHGANVSPNDLDITPNLDIQNLIRLSRTLEDIEAQLDPDAPAGHWETRDDSENYWVEDDLTPELRQARILWTPDPKDFTTFDHLFYTRYGNFDVVPDLGGKYESLSKRAVLMNVRGYEVKVAHIDDLLTALTVPRRKKDTIRVHQLRNIQRIQRQ